MPNICDQNYLKFTTDFEHIFTGAAGTAEQLCEFSEYAPNSQCASVLKQRLTRFIHQRLIYVILA